MVGSSIGGLNFSGSSTNVSFYPRAGYFVVDNLAVGLSIYVDYSSTSNNGGSTSLGVGPFVRYYFGDGKLKPLLEANFNYIHGSYKYFNGQTTESDSYTNASLKGGVAYFISDNVSIDGIVGYTRDLQSGMGNLGSIGISFGFQVFLGN